MYSCVDGLLHRLLETLFLSRCHTATALSVSLRSPPSQAGKAFVRGIVCMFPPSLGRGGGWLPQRGERECEGSGILVFQTILISLADSVFACQ